MDGIELNYGWGKQEDEELQLYKDCDDGLFTGEQGRKKGGGDIGCC
jgi:hypothetical protein